jgi:DNA-binding LytR/AlgR family response regulator
LDGKVCAVCETETLQLKQRLYEVEAMLPETFVKINQSCLANLRKVERFDASVSGTLMLRFRNGYTDYVSRRQLKFIKERLGMK